MADYIELYKKYRPKKWEEVIGQKATVDSIRNAILNNTLPTGYLFSGTAGTGKALHKDTLIPTPTGFITMGELKVGDIVLGSNGKPCIVLRKYCPHDKNMYVIDFDNHESVKTSGGHLWEVLTRNSRLKLNKNSYDTLKEVLSTEEMKDNVYVTKNKYKNYSIKKSLPVQYESKKLELHPYILGLWLGDGNSDRHWITKSEEDINAINEYLKNNLPNYSIKLVNETKGNKTNFYEILKDGKSIKPLLVKLNLIKNKHIPDDYIYNSISNRYNLIRGLFDTDGTVEGFLKSNKNKGTQITFGQYGDEKKHIVDNVYLILSSLGFKVFYRTKQVTTEVKGTKIFNYISFSVRNDVTIFNLKRKQDKVSLGQRVHDNYFITNITKIEDNPKDYFCIEVDSHNHLFLCTKSFIPTHNTTISLLLAKAVNCEHLDENGNPCNKCDSCKAIDDNSQLGFKYISMANDGSVDNIRRIMEDSFLSQPIKKKVFILDEVQNLSGAAQEAMLIGLEDTKQDTLFLCCTTNPEKIRPAILSRLQSRQLQEPNLKELAHNLLNIVKQEKQNNSTIIPPNLTEPQLKEYITQAVKSANGSVRNSVRNLETLLSGGKLGSSYNQKIIETIRDRQIDVIYLITPQMVSDGINFANALESLYKDFSEILQSKLTNQSVKYGETFTPKFCLIALEEIGNTLCQISSKVIDSRILYEICVAKLVKYWEKFNQKQN